jgi:undecaprenyl-phosphate 4-deoxy-4-formamido-L-arabinose transferase
MISISLVIPVYKSEGCLRELYCRIVATLEQITNDYEIIFVEDCGGDRSWDVIVEIARIDRRVKGHKMSRNYGQHNALLAGIRSAQHPVIVTLDDDLQNPPEEIHKLLSKLDEGYDVVYGTPEYEQHGLLRDAASIVTKLILQNVMGAQTARKISSFRAFRSHVRNGFNAFEGPYVSIDVLLTWATARFAAIAVEHKPRSIGRSNYTLKKLLLHTFNMLTGFSTWPLQIASLMGFLFTLFGLGVLLYVVGRFLLLGWSAPGFPFIASIISIFSGVQLFTLGIIGEYLARMHCRAMQQPAYVIYSSVNFSQ